MTTATMPSQEAMRRLDAWKAAESSGRGLTMRDGFLYEVKEGAQVSRYAYSREGDLTVLTEPDGTRWEYGYGADGRLLYVRRNGEIRARYDYGEGGRLIEVERPEGRIRHTYDTEGRPARILRGDASALVYRFEGDRVVEARCDREVTRFAYREPSGAVSPGEAAPPVAASPASVGIAGLEQGVDGIFLSVQFHHDGLGRLERMSFPSWGIDFGYAWDGKGRPLEVRWKDEALARYSYEDGEKLSRTWTADGLEALTRHDPMSGSPVHKALLRGTEVLWEKKLALGPDLRLERDGDRRYAYDALGRLARAEEPGRSWCFRYDAMDNLVGEEGPVGPREYLSGMPVPGMPPSARRIFLEKDRAGRLTAARGERERIYRYNQAGEAVRILDDGRLLAECAYDHKGRLLLKRTASVRERYFYGPDDELLAVADDDGSPRHVYLRLPTGLVGVLDFTEDPEGEFIFLHTDERGNLVFQSGVRGELAGPFACDPFACPEVPPSRMPYCYRGRFYHADLGLYWMGCRWYDPGLRRFLTPDTYTGAPDDERLVNPLRTGQAQRAARAQILGEWLKQPRVRNRLAFCGNDPVNRFDPNGHWSFGGVLLSVLGAIWTLPNTIFGLVVEITCLVGEVVRWLVWLVSFGNASWETPGFDVAASGRLNAFALVFTGGWLGSFQGLLAITFGNVFFTNKTWRQHAAYTALPAQVAPPAYNGSVTIPKEQALYEHELRHVNQYAWFGPFFHLGLPIFGVYEWDVIFNGYQDAWMERDAREHGGF